MPIPKLIHQIYLSNQPLPSVFDTGVTVLKNNNPGYKHILYGNREVEEIIHRLYGNEILKAYLSINPAYGAARADLFRYLIMHEYGGVYLDIKSALRVPLDAVIYPTDQFIVCQWDKKPDAQYPDCGYHPDLHDFFNGEYVQWCLIAEPKSPFMAAVIKQTLLNIKNYTFQEVGVGRRAVLKTTGPVMYTLTISELLKHHPHRLVGGASRIGAYWSVHKNHNQLMKTDYTTCRESLVLV